MIDRNSDPKNLVHLGGYAGHVTGVNFSVHGNTLANVEVVKALAAALAVAIKRQPRQWKAQAAADPFFAKIKDQPAFAQLVT